MYFWYVMGIETCEGLYWYRTCLHITGDTFNVVSILYVPYVKVFTKMVVTITVLFSIPVVSFANTSDLVTAILSTSFQYPICQKETTDISIEATCARLILSAALRKRKMRCLPLRDRWSLIPWYSLSSWLVCRVDQTGCFLSGLPHAPLSQKIEPLQDGVFKCSHVQYKWS